MGMDYQYCGSASYPRFEEEIIKVAELFGGRSSKELENKINDVNSFVNYMFGPFTKVKGDKFIFPEGTNEVFVKFFNHPYDELSPTDTKTVYDILKEKRDEVMKISDQIMDEFECLVEYGEGWYIT